MHLPLSIRLKLIRQDVLAALRVGGQRPVRIDAAAEGALIRADGRDVYVPSPLRWKLYRQGWPARLDRLEQEYGLARHVTLGADSVVIDIGANVGEFAHVCTRYGARVHCLEPDPVARACLEKNVADLSNVRVHALAAWTKDGEIDFGLAPARADSSAFVDADARIAVPAARLETFIERERIDRVALLKCDAEGAEPEVLEGLGEAFARVDVLALDTGAERQGARTHAPCARILSAHGFEVREEKIGSRWMTFGLNPQSNRPAD